MGRRNGRRFLRYACAVQDKPEAVQPRSLGGGSPSRLGPRLSALRAVPLGERGVRGHVLPRPRGWSPRGVGVAPGHGD
ncbi:unnamed protein product, partial [Ectocarpus fasciculatus]